MGNLIFKKTQPQLNNTADITNSSSNLYKFYCKSNEDPFDFNQEHGKYMIQKIKII